MSESDEISYELFKPFGPFVGDFTIPRRIVDTLNRYTDEVVADGAKAQNLDLSSYLAGEVTQEFKVDPAVVEGELGRYLMDITATYIEVTTGRKISKFKVLGCWIVRSFEGDFNPPHNHRGHVSGAGYLMIPDQIGSSEGSRKRARTAGMINFVHGTDQFLSGGHISMLPKVGHIFLFPHYLNHSVNPFSGSGERRSFSFNALIDDEIYDIHSNSRLE
ncbi:MAG: hypothetical protein COW30_11260 [Rhodospirillales bacterium CG15_BIG_FIL_POST_REV_8_21_14_020_66_15]|nr:MAG: hypothetical protein COW30_11260 [Rhodospirillales bacterium CG15_BIG_FIL_POST_REV_8_21_14_020_66_15]